MTTSGSNRGFALVTSLLVLLVIAALATGALFLSNMNLRIAENTMTNAIARFNAESGLDQTYVVMASYVLGEGKTVLPADLGELTAELAEWDMTDGWQVVGYERYVGTGRNGADQARVRVRGTGPRNARHDVEALVEAVISPSHSAEGYTLFGEGFVALEDIDIAGGGTYDIPFWAGGSINLRSATVVEGNSIVASGGSCRWGAPPRDCNAGDEERGPPPVEAPDFDALRQAVMDNQDPAALAACLANPFSGSSITASDGPLVCLPNGASVTISSARPGLVVIGNSTTRVQISTRTGSDTDDSVPGVTVVSSEVTFGAGAEFYGTNTIIAEKDIVFGKNVVSRDETARTFIVTEGNFTLSGTGASNIYASFWVGGDFNWNGTPNNFRGTIVAAGSISGNGCGSFCNIRPPDELENVYIPIDSDDDAGGWGIWVLARR